MVMPSYLGDLDPIHTGFKKLTDFAENVYML